jgi:hypothetical protein
VSRRIFGLDFSGASDAGRRIWLAQAERTPTGIEVSSCESACELPGGAVDRASALAALRDFITRSPDAIFGCDFPFSLPRALIAAPDWTTFIADFDDVDASAFRARCRQHSPNCEPKRLTDVEAKTPWCAFNVRLYRQSFHGLAEVLRPLVALGRAAALPMQAAMADRAWLIETCPASVLKHLGWRGSYKGGTLKRQRQEILQFLTDRSSLRPLSIPLQRRVVDDPGGDALDSIIAALATAAALDEITDGGDSGDPLEGRVYFRA